MTVVVGTAGHIDHGKTTLLRALTGTDADRLPEEQRRGLTIDVGYAHASPDGGPEIDFVDVPGHDRLVGNMLVGAGEIDACLLVVSADDGPRAQTWEHVGLLDALGIDQGLVAVTKTDLVEEARVIDVVGSLRLGLAATSLAGAAFVPVSGQTGDGLDALREALAELRDAVDERLPARADGPVRLALDRVFSIHGRGLVVTGSSRGRRIRTGDSLRAVPGDVILRVRGIQVHDRDVDAGPLGGRVALNLAGAAPDALARGRLLVSGEADDLTGPVATDRLLVSLRRPVGLPDVRSHDAWPPPDGVEARLHIGTDQCTAVLGRSGRDDVLFPDGSAAGMLRLDRPVAAASGERFVLRRPPPAGLLAGGVVLDPQPARGRSRRRQTPGRLSKMHAAMGGPDQDGARMALLSLHGLVSNGRRRLLAPDVEAAARSAALEAVRAHQAEQPGSAGLPLAALRGVAAAVVRQMVTCTARDGELTASDIAAHLVASGELERDGDHVRTPDHTPEASDPRLEAAMGRLVDLLDMPAPPALRAAAAEAGCPADGLRELEREGRIVVVGDDLAWSAPAYEALRDQALSLARTSPLTPAALRDATGTSRKYVMALLEDLDRRGILKRTPSGHVPGPRA